MQAGFLNRFGSLRQRSTVSASGAVETGTWDVVNGWDSVWANFAPMRGATADANGFEQERTWVRITIRFRDGVTNKMRFRDVRNSIETDYDIEAVRDPDGLKTWLEMDCVRSEETP